MKPPALEPQLPEDDDPPWVYVLYDKSDGTILSVSEKSADADEKLSHPWGMIEEPRVFAEVNLTGDMAEKGLIDIHDNYKVVVSRRKARLVPKG